MEAGTYHAWYIYKLLKRLIYDPKNEGRTLRKMAEFIQDQYNLLECIYKLRYDTETNLKIYDKMDAKLKATMIERIIEQIHTFHSKLQSKGNLV